MAKLIIMGTAPNIPPPNIPPSDREPLSDAEVKLEIAYLLAEIQQNLGATSNAVRILEDARKIYDERILQLIERTTRTESAIPGLKETVDRHTADLNGLGRRSHTTDTLAKIALGILTPVAAGLLIAIIAGVYHVIERLLALAK